jgi:ribosomal protein S18 acetylase RimI-like enzyme
VRAAQPQTSPSSVVDNDCRVKNEVRRAVVSDIDRASVVLGEAFADYAWTKWTVDPSDHLSRVTQLQRIALQSYGLPFGDVWVAMTDGALQSVAVWMDSAIVVPSAVHDRVRMITAALEGSRHEASMAAEQELSGWRPVVRHYYLAAVGTTPSMQGRGLARAVLRPVLTTADGEGACAFLETSSASNVAFYRNLGFEVTDHRLIRHGGPDVWAMLRHPQLG